MCCRLLRHATGNVLGFSRSDRNLKLGKVNLGIAAILTTLRCLAECNFQAFNVFQLVAPKADLSAGQSPKIGCTDLMLTE